MATPAVTLPSRRRQERVEVAPSILAVDDEPSSLGLLQYLLDAAGYRVNAVADAMAAAAEIDRAVPDLVIADYGMPDVDGVELTRAIRSDPRLAAVSIIMVTARSLTRDKLAGLAAGVDDYITKPFEPQELLARVHTVLRRARELRAQSPLTGMPGNVRIEQEIARRIDAGEPFAVLYADLDHFKAYNDHYGFGAGDKALRTAGWLIQRVVRDSAGASAFVGHLGGDDFVAVIDAALGPAVAGDVIGEFDRMVPGLYSASDVARGFIEVLDRNGELTRFPLMTLSIGVTTSLAGPYVDAGEAIRTASSLKSQAKHVRGSGSCLEAADRAART